MKPPYFKYSLWLCIFILFSYLTLAQETKVVTRTLDLKPDGTVYIDTYKGSITVETWSKPQVQIDARIEPEGHSKHEIEKVKRTEIQIDSSEHEIRIKSDYEELKRHTSWFISLFGDDNGNLPYVHYKIFMPSTAKLEIKDYKSKTKISNLHSSLEINTYKGDVTVDNLDGSIDVETYKGEVKTTVTRLAGNSRFKTYKGEIHITLLDSSGFDLDADIGRKADFTSDFDTVVKSKYHRSERFHGTVNGGGPVLYISTDKGEIHLNKK